MRIRAELPGEAGAIDALTERAFDGHPYSDGSEVPILRLLRRHGDLTLSLVAEDGGEIVGHAAFSPVRIGAMAGQWYGLGPISVAPKRQRRGIGRALVAEGLAWLRAHGAAGCVLVGDPAVYHPMGFKSGGAVGYGPVERVYVHWMAFDDAPPEGEITFAPAFTEWETQP